MADPVPVYGNYQNDFKAECDKYLTLINIILMADTCFLDLDYCHHVWRKASEYETGGRGWRSTNMTNSKHYFWKH